MAHPPMSQSLASAARTADSGPALIPLEDILALHRALLSARARMPDLDSFLVEVLDTLISRLAPGGEIVLAGFYSEPLAFAFAPAFMREARLRVAAEWREPDLAAVAAMAESGALSLDGLITHRCDASQADGAYRTAFGDPACLKMILDWRQTA